MNILFVSSGNNGEPKNIISDSQAISLICLGMSVEKFYIKKKGVIGYFQTIFALRHALSKLRPSIIHAHYGWSGIVALIAAFGMGIKLVVSFMGDDIIGELGRTNQYTLAGRLTSILNRVLAFLFYDHVIVKSNQMKSRLGLFQDCSILPNGVNLEIFKPIDMAEARKCLNLSMSKKIILFASDPARPEKQYSLAESTVKHLGSCEDILLLTIFGKPQEVLNLYYNASDVLLLTSSHEGSPNVIKEAMATNLPIVSTDVGDVANNLKSVTQCHVCSQDALTLANALTTILESEERSNGRDRILELRLDSGSIAEQLIEIYKSTGVMV